MGTLYIVSTPIGNLEDITLRALRILKEVPLIAAEDTRHTRKLLNHFSIATPTKSYHSHSAPARTGEILAALESGDVALVTDAGTPGLSDPGGELVKAASEDGFPVVPVPGPSALLAAVAASGLDTSKFVFLGFLPRKGREREALIEKASATGWPFVVYESPQRAAATLADLHRQAGDRPVAVGRELTKLHEEIFRGTLSAAEAHFSEGQTRGEVTIVVGGAAPGMGERAQTAAAPDLDSVLAELASQGLSAREIARRAAGTAGVGRREAYNRLLQLQQNQEQQTADPSARAREDDQEERA